MGFLLFFQWLIIILVAVAAYVFAAIGLYKIGVRNGVKYAWLAFIPILQFYIVGSICEEYVLFGYRIRHLGWVMCVLMLLRSVSGGFSMAIISLAAAFLSLLILHKFFYLFNPQRAMIYTLLSILGSLPVAIILFIIKDSPMIMSAGGYPYPFAEKRW